MCAKGHFVDDPLPEHVAARTHTDKHAKYAGLIHEAIISLQTDASNVYSLLITTVLFHGGAK